jgi:protein involved in polysaccharide export with SLBB domain
MRMRLHQPEGHRRRMVVMLALLAASSGVAVPVPAAVAQTPPTASGASLSPGDAIRLAFWRDPSLSGEYPVDETGVVVLPHIGVRQVTDLSPAELRARLLAEYGAVLENQGVHVTLLRRVRVLGAVRTPGLYLVDGTMSVADAVALAGGVLPNGRADAVRVLRDGGQIRVDLRAPSGADPDLQSGDQITVAESSWFARNSAALLGAGISALGFLLGQAIF